jgi:hypothetical protein
MVRGKRNRSSLCTVYIHILKCFYCTHTYELLMRNSCSGVHEASKILSERDIIPVIRTTVDKVCWHETPKLTVDTDISRLFLVLFLQPGYCTVFALISF